ncbi:interferon kappa-like [Podarcis lilfordi]|uniref:Interferon kappa-like n=1 Tax=Podarcis lilfordi TaxID=74358 RepID=A0AA35LHM0_9SAUR|nr:interferon kappa-like [Podarcis lilfordi]
MKTSATTCLNARPWFNNGTDFRTSSSGHSLPDSALYQRPHSFISTMITKGWLLHVGLIMLFVSRISSLDCNQFHSWLHEANKANLELLKNKMGTTIPIQCIGEEMDISTNQEIFTNINEVQVENAKGAIQEILQQILHIFRQNHTEMGWDGNSTTAFQTKLDQQIQKLETCWSAELERGPTSPRGQKTLLARLRVKRYFQILHDLLKDKEYSRCAWVTVQIQIRQCFVLTDQLIKRISN